MRNLDLSQRGFASRRKIICGSSNRLHRLDGMWGGSEMTENLMAGCSTGAGLFNFDREDTG